MIENVNEIKEYLDTNKENTEVVDFMKSIQQPLTLNRDTVETWCKEGEGRSWLDRNCDIYSQKAVETARTNALEKYQQEEVPKLIEAELAKLNNQNKTPEQLKLEEVMSEMEKMKSEKARTDLSNKFIKELNTKGIDTEWIDFVLGNDEETTNAKLEKLVGLLGKATDSKVKEKLGDFSYTPKETQKNTDEVTIDQFKKMGVMERTKLKQTNIELYNKLNSQILK